MRRSLCTPWLVLVLLWTVAGTAQEKKHLTFEQIFNDAEPRLLEQLPAIPGWADDENYLVTRGERRGGRVQVFAVNAKTGEERLYRDLGQYREILGEGINPFAPVANDEAYRRLIYEKENDLYFLNTETKELKRLTTSEAEEKNPTLSPDGRAVAFTRGGNLFSIDLGTGKEIQYTSDTLEPVSNGYASWLYYEEILGRASRYRAFWWSPDSRHIAFYRFDDSRVPIFPIVGVEGQHGSMERTRYPEVGDPNPMVRFGVVTSGDGGKIVWAKFEENLDQYFGMPFWIPNGKAILVQWMNRRQDTLKLFAVDPSTGEIRNRYVEHQPSWVDWLEKVTFVGDDGECIVKSDRDGWAHLYLLRADGTLKTRLTEGRWSVAALELLDERHGRVFFSAKKENSTRSDLYCVGLDGRGLRRLTAGPFSHSVMVSPGGSYFITRYSNVATPTCVALYASNGSLIRELGNSKTRAFDEYQIAPTELLRIPSKDGYALPMTLVLPLAMDSSRKYPVIMSVYGGPGSETVSDTWHGLTAQWWAEEGIIQVSIDHRGSGHFGKEGEALMYRNLGKWEMHDYIAAVKWLRAKPYVDSSRVCITGGSYGGYVTALALTEGAEYFTHGIATSSVIDWQLYDSHYTERYMGTKSDNPDGYAFASVLTHADKYRGLLRLVHGTSDENVHLQNTMQLVDKLEDLGKHFELMLYPGGRHGWGGAKAIHSRNETYRFYYAELLGKEFPEQLFKSVRPRRRF
jgi:dipeptidyl-peptidase-4